ncbi:hypothetical protein Xen7305DRAFT_00021630 [Xenococcus sp. PCC 7305]|uniref:NACHT domain-containing protein n=1 Tax=Xenococcus sp. PCC 7305 TaxID=102125 RepID=UPI0002AC2CCB|nr:hypothetical protein [Xenococcus sp. PCC 7305]ELS02449.1 hypothetical protein Xen7305DRAFT_00021630 [Xenococcus sp. PCC 7305]
MYNWTRFWCPTTGNLRLDSSGFLYDPESEYSKYYQSDLVGFDDISKIPCLILLGEAGIGKTTATEQEYEKIETKLQRSQDDCLWFRLGDYDSDNKLCNKIFENERFKDWLDGNHQLYLFLDSLDEGLLSIKILSRILKREIDKLPCDRLYLRITCRTADWKNSLTEKFQDNWGKDQVGIYELCPLRQVDIEEAINQKNINSNQFFEELIDKEAVPLAIKPITLKFLLSQYSKNACFPLSQKELYERGCLELCKEVSPNRLECDFDGELSDKQRLIVVGRIAAITIFANKVAIWTNSDNAEMPESDISKEDLCIDQEKIDGQEFNITKQCIKEVLSISGLFSSRGENRMGFAHKTYAEFLAAWYLNHHQIPLVQIMSLIVSPEDAEKKLVPQLHETAAWLASLNYEVLEKIMTTDPDVLLKSDVSEDAKLRKAIVNSLLEQYEQEKLFDRDFSKYLRYKKLNHSKLAEQLRPYIQDNNKNFNVRYEAIKIAEACEVKELQDDLVDLALDTTQQIDLRSIAASMIASIGDSETRLKLKPLAVKELLEDEEDSLKGNALRAVWSEHLSAKELFSVFRLELKDSSIRLLALLLVQDDRYCAIILFLLIAKPILTPRKKSNLHGSYSGFLDYELLPKLQVEDIPIALNWLEIQGVRCFGHPFENLGDNLLLKAWECFDDPEIVKGFAKVALVQWREYQDVITLYKNSQGELDFSFSRDDDKRRKLIEQSVLLIVNSGGNLDCLFGSSSEEIDLEKDILWMLEKIQETEEKRVQEIYTKLVKYHFNRKDAKQIDAINVATQSNETLNENFASWFEAIELNSAQAKEAKKEYLMIKGSKNAVKKKTSPSISTQKKLQVYLENFDDNYYFAWRDITRTLSLRPNSNYFESLQIFKTDLTLLPGWQSADIQTRTRIVEAAKKYIVSNEPGHLKYIRELLKAYVLYKVYLYKIILWQRLNATMQILEIICQIINKNVNDITTHETDFLGYKALKLVYQQDYQFIQKLPQNIWQKWSSFILLCVPNKSEQSQSDRDLINLAYKNSAKKIENELLILIDRENHVYKDIFSIDKVDCIWNTKIEKLLQSISTSSILEPEALYKILDQLFEHKPQNNHDFVDVLFSSLNLTRDHEPEKVIVILSTWFRYNATDSWSTIWSEIQQDLEFGKKLIHRITWGILKSSILDLSEKDLADLYIWLVHQYPYEKDPIYDEAHVVEPRERIARFRDSILTQLKETGTFQSCQEIRRIASKFPELNWLKATLFDAQRNRRTKTWQPPKPYEILKLIRDGNKRLINDGNELLEVLIDSLKRLELELQGETPGARDVWDKIDPSKKHIYKPVDENTFSDYVKRFLDRDLKQRGIIANREVELRPSQGGAKGERTDIHVDVVKKSNGEIYDSITVIIEVKGCWHKELDTAMETQLLNRYLKDNACQHGLYLIGWFHCEQWDSSDYRKGKAPKISLVEAKEKFDQQAKDLSQLGSTVQAFVLNAALK